MVDLLQARELLEDLPLPMQIVKIPHNPDHKLRLAAWPIPLQELEMSDSLALIDGEDQPHGNSTKRP